MEQITVAIDHAFHGKKQLLYPLHFSIKQGECFVIIGESGAGKSLLSKILIGQTPPLIRCQGSIRHENRSIPLRDYALVQHQIAYMAQNPMSLFNPVQTIYSHFLETILSKYTLKKEALDALISEKLAYVGLPLNSLHQYPFELSGGMLQRVMLAMMLCLDCQTYILDEPTSALDTQNSDNIMHLLKKLKQEEKTIVIITHDYYLAEQLADTMLIMKQGRALVCQDKASVFSKQDDPYIQTLLKNPFERLV